MTSDLLGKILTSKAEEVARRAAARPLAGMRDAAAAQAPARGFVGAIERVIERGRAAVIAEIKKASPSRGILRADFDPAAIARSYAEHGAACLSVLTDQPYFDGRDHHLGEARAACDLPVLRKDFIIDAYQVFEARALGADAVLLIAAALGDPMMRELAGLADALGMDALVEVHNRAELERALTVPCRLIGINNRDLRTFETSLDTTLALLDAIPAGRIVVTESGLRRAADIALMRQHGVQAFLVGEAFMRAADPGEELRTMFAS